ncbi:hypothetical protein HNQ85_002442 [Anoxybacillus calidus]|uniref:Uncharacterized protein n=1 Tax=[Anoxybacillus] calidus TaxID=575178 RepID=A0A7V9Z128_9BACL|nr:hypothetical protein [Anoxybacillus calidus]
MTQKKPIIIGKKIVTLTSTSSATAKKTGGCGCGKKIKKK